MVVLLLYFNLFEEEVSLDYHDQIGIQATIEPVSDFSSWDSGISACHRFDFGILPIFTA